MSECCIYDLIKMRVVIWLNALYTKSLKWEMIYVWMLHIWYYLNDRWYIPESFYYDIINIRGGMSVCSLYAILKMRGNNVLNALYISLKWEVSYVW